MAGDVGSRSSQLIRILFIAVTALPGCHHSAAPPREAPGLAGLFPPNVPDLVHAVSATTAPAPVAPKIIDNGTKATLVYIAQHAQPEVLKDAVSGLLNPDGTAQDSAALNSLIIQDETPVVNGILDVLRSLDQPTPQLLVEARVVEVTLTSDLEYEITHTLKVNSPELLIQSSDITLKTPGAGAVNQGSSILIRPWSSDDVTLDNFVRLLQSRGNANILSNPNVIVSPGTESSIITGQEVPVVSQNSNGGTVITSTTFKRVGIKLRVELLQLTHDTARMLINPEVSTVTGFTNISSGVANPIISLRNVTSTVSLKDGEILTIGGLLDDERNVNTRGIPWLQDTPGLGALFQSKRDQTTKTQLIFFLRVHILPEGAPNGQRLHAPGAGLESFGKQPGTEPRDYGIPNPPVAAPVQTEGSQP
jgi:type II secretory pathway component GspD/PulD (secretin)